MHVMAVGVPTMFTFEETAKAGQSLSTFKALA